MIYRFYSKASADLIMLGESAKRILTLIGKTPDTIGIITAEQIPEALTDIQTAITAEMEQKAKAQESAKVKQLSKLKFSGITLAQRSHTLQTMLKQSYAAKEPVLWQVR